MPTPRIRIPHVLKSDRPTIALVTSRRNLLLRYAVIDRRVNPSNPKRSRIESARTKERRLIRDRLRVIETELLQILGQATKHPDLYEGTKHCRRYELISQWVLLKRPHRASDPQSAAERRAMRERICHELQAQRDAWLSLLTLIIFPDDPIPPLRKLDHVRHFKP